MILIVGSTGLLGGIIAKRLLAEGRQVRILIRHGSNYQPLVDTGAQPVFGDLKNPASLDAACKGIETLITTANSAERGGDDNPYTVEMQGNRNLIDAAKAAEVRQFIFVAGSYYDPNAPFPLIAGRSQTEDYLRASGMNYTIIAPTAFGEMWLKNVIVTPVLHGAPVTVIGGDPGKIAFISLNDVASFIIASIGHPAAINQRLLLMGPQAISFSEAARIFGRLINREIPIVSVQPGDPVPFLPEIAQPLMIGLCLGGDTGPMNDLARIFRVELKPPEVILQQMAIPQL